MRRESASPHEAPGAPRSFKTMIRFGNVTYRIGRLRYGHYEIVRILDDARLGTFQSFPCVTVTSASIHPAFILKIAHAAARGASASWFERLAIALRRSENVTLQKPDEQG